MKYSIHEYGIRDMDIRWLGEYIQNQGKHCLQSLILHENQLNDDMIIELVQDGLMHNRTLRDLNMAHNNITNAGAHAIADWLSTASVLQSLSLHDNRITVESAHSIANALATNTALTQLDVSLNALQDDGVCSIVQALRSNVHSKVATLNISDTYAGSKTLHALIDLLPHSRLTTLNMANNIDMCDSSKPADAALVKSFIAAVQQSNVTNIMCIGCGFDEAVIKELQLITCKKMVNNRVRTK